MVTPVTTLILCSELLKMPIIPSILNEERPRLRHFGEEDGKNLRGSCVISLIQRGLSPSIRGVNMRFKIWKRMESEHGNNKLQERGRTASAVGNHIKMKCLGQTKKA